MQDTIDLILRKQADVTELRAPEVGLFTCALASGALLGPGQLAGVILTAGRSIELRVPAGVHGRIANAPRPRTQAPVGYGDVLYELQPVDGAVADELADQAAADESGLILKATQSGRFYHRPAPDEPAYASPGDELVDGQAIGLLEIMKTFSQVAYGSAAGLPGRAILVRFLAEDGGEIREGDGLIEVEPA
jgi:acetyl-CoA carboxylase biotin carboxyl carrier protein